MKVYWTTKEKFEKYENTLPKELLKYPKEKGFRDVPYKDGILIFFKEEIYKADL